jgi:hypothetical protein
VPIGAFTPGEGASTIHVLGNLVEVLQRWMWRGCMLPGRQPGRLQLGFAACSNVEQTVLCDRAKGPSSYPTLYLDKASEMRFGTLE